MGARLAGYTNHSHRPLKMLTNIGRIRHEKCDQTKPACSKCTATGRKCDFLDALAPPTDQTVVSTPSYSSTTVSRYSSRSPRSTPSSPLPNFELDERDGQFFQYFVHAASTSFFNSCGSPIWNLILQVAQTDPVIRSVALATAILHNLHPYIAANPGDSTYIPVYKSAIRHYASAVKGLKDKLARLEGGPDLETWEISILASFLFTSFELLIGNEDGAHLQNTNGFNMMRSALNTYRAHPFQIELPGSLKTLVMGMNRRDLQASTFSYGWTTQALLVPNVPNNFLSFTDAIAALETIMVNILMLIRMHALADPCRRWSHEINDRLQRRIDDLKDSLEHWFKTFNRWLSFRELLAPGEQMSTEEKIIHNTLMIQYWNSYIWIHTPFTRTQMVFDGYLEQFTNIVNLGEETLQLYPEKSAMYSGEMEIIQPLFYVVQKCRDPVVRRRALGLLLVSGREGVWDGLCMAVAGNLIVEIEEEGMIDGVDWVEDRYRLRGINLHANRVEKKLMVKGRRITDDGEEVWAWRTMSWGEQNEGGKTVYGDETDSWHWAFLFG